jgi:transcriptional regulator with XRE-family HTH domain
LKGKNRIKELRISKGMKQDELGRRCGVKQGAVSTWETGASNPKPEAMQIMCELFGVSLGYLMGIEDEEKEEESIENIRYALSGEIRDLTEDEERDILDYVRFKKSQRKTDQ